MTHDAPRTRPGWVGILVGAALDGGTIDPPLRERLRALGYQR